MLSHYHTVFFPPNTSDITYHIYPLNTILLTLVMLSPYLKVQSFDYLSHPSTDQFFLSSIIPIVIFRILSLITQHILHVTLRDL